MLSPFSHVQTLCNLMAYSPLVSSIHGIQYSVFSRQECWSGLPCLLQGLFPTQGLNPYLLCLLHWQGGSLPLAPPGKPHCGVCKVLFTQLPWAISKSCISILTSTVILNLKYIISGICFMNPVEFCIQLRHVDNGVVEFFSIGSILKPK